MLNKILNVFGYHAVIVRVNEADGIYWCFDYWADVTKYESESDHKTFAEVASLFNRRRKQNGN